MNKLYIITGGTINKIAPHFAISAPAYGKIGEEIFNELSLPNIEVILIKTKMADSKFKHDSFSECNLKHIETNNDLKLYLTYLNEQKSTYGVILSSAIADFTIDLPDELKNKRLSSNDTLNVQLKPSEKLLQLLKNDILKVSFKTLYNEDNSEIIKEKSNKNSSFSDIIFINDIGKLSNGISINNKITWFKNRKECIDVLCKIIYAKNNLFSRFCVKCGEYKALNFKESLNNCQCCGTKRPSIMSYSTILKYKYDIET